jgi:hypothetical protein
LGSSIVSGLIGGLVSLALCAYISSKVRGAAQPGTLRYGTWLVVLAWCCVAFVGFAMSAFFYDRNVWEDPTELWSVVGLIAGFGLAAVYCFGEFFATRGAYDDNGIDFHTPWTGRKTERWDDLNEVAFNSQASWFVLTFRSGRKVRISTLIGGHGDVLALLDARGVLPDERFPDDER